MTYFHEVCVVILYESGTIYFFIDFIFWCEQSCFGTFAVCLWVAIKLVFQPMDLEKIVKKV